jgi:hypothetical protein
MAMTSENRIAMKAHLRAYMIDQILRFPQHIAQEPARLLLFDPVKRRSAIPAAEQTVKELAILAESIIAINKEHSLTPPNQIRCHGQVWSIRTFDALFFEYRGDGLGRIQNDVTRPKNAYGRNIP